ncbi:hypothetical protein Krac_1909 [Ktedonobacter racemifer DSM 44963]|uniref:Uncharacterized protein n=1 Tax=Ktedonobacter racemifer DSM 44963 TaxID=485913 RepID=D6U3X0_KTERA|nr:hypothetical protein Krac_1909 [Ktedonobacter racemifer DSM 44963]
MERDRDLEHTQPDTRCIGKVRRRTPGSDKPQPLGLMLRAAHERTRQRAKEGTEGWAGPSPPFTASLTIPPTEIVTRKPRLLMPRRNVVVC